MKKVLNAGCAGSTLKEIFPGWEEVRMDIVDADKENPPDTIGSITKIPFEDKHFNAVWCQDVLEHVYLHEAIVAIKEFHRVLDVGGVLYVNSPNMMEICKRVVNSVHTKAYDAPCGKIAWHDMIYGYQPRVKNGDTYMQHKCGFDLPSLTEIMTSIGFKFVHGKEELAVSVTGIKV